MQEKPKKTKALLKEQIRYKIENSVVLSRKLTDFGMNAQSETIGISKLSNSRINASCYKLNEYITTATGRPIDLRVGAILLLDFQPWYTATEATLIRSVAPLPFYIRQAKRHWSTGWTK